MNIPNFILVVLLLMSTISTAQIPDVNIVIFNSDKEPFKITYILKDIDSLYEIVEHLPEDEFFKSVYLLDTLKNNYINNSLNKLYSFKNKEQILDINFQNNILVLSKEKQCIYFIIEEEYHINYSNRFGILILNEIPLKKGTYVISIGSDLNNPLFFPIDINFGLEITKRGILANRISNKVITPNEIIVYLNNRGSKTSCGIRKLLKKINNN